MTHLRRIVLGVNTSSLRHDSNSLTGFIWSTMFIRNLQVLHGGYLNFFPFYQAQASTICPFTHDFNTCIVQKKGIHKTENDSTWHHLSYKLAYPRTCQSTLLSWLIPLSVLWILPWPSHKLHPISQTPFLCLQLLTSTMGISVSS